MGQVQLLFGKPNSGKTSRCLSAYVRANSAPGERQFADRCLWLTPAREARQAVLERLLPLAGGVVFQPNVLTFDRFAERVLNETNHRGRFIAPLERRTILRLLIAQSQVERKFRHFERIAGTEGFLDVVASFITELKRAEIWPDTFLAACRERFGAAGRRDTELGTLYQRYQDILQKQNWYDAEGRFWLARTAMQNSIAAFWREMSLVVVDGFSDFTRTQQEMLEQLAMGAREMLVTLPLEHPLARPELFTKPDSVRVLLQRRFKEVVPVKTLVCDEQFVAQPTGLRHLQERLFENPRTVPRQASTEGLTLLAATGDRAEQAAIAVRIKRLLARGVSPHEIVVGLRSAAVSGPLWKAYLTSAGIPVWCEATAPWSRSPYLKALFSVLQLETEDWAFARLKGVLNSSFFRPRLEQLPWQPNRSPAAVTGWLRRLQLHSRRTLILKTLHRRWERADDTETEEDRYSLALTIQALAELSDATELLRRSHSLTEWADVLGRVTTRLGLVSHDDEASPADVDQLQSLLRAAAKIEAELSEQPAPRSLADMLELLRDIVQHGSSTPADRPEGRVRIVGAESLRHLQPAHVFLVELTEDAFPARRTEDCLYSEGERQQLHEGGVQLSHREMHQREEMLLFYQSLTRARAHLTLSFSRVNSQGHETYPSPYVTAVTELFEPTLVPERVGQLDPLPDLREILTVADQRLAAVAQARDHHPGWWKLLLENQSPIARNMLAAGEVAAQRFHTEGFTNFEGRLTHTRHRAALAQRFGSQRQFSATELESYATCPFRFWVKDVLELRPPPSPEIATDHAGRGSLIHDILAKLSDETTSEASEVAARFRELVLDRLPTASENELQQALLHVERELMQRWADAFGDQHRQYVEQVAERELAGLRTITEVPFGAARDADAQAPQERFPPLVLGAGEESIRLGGRIDRVDVSEADGQTVFSLIDYKTGKPPDFSPAKLPTGQGLQLALYTLAVMRLEIAGPAAMPLWVGYWSVKESGFAPSGKRGSKWSPLDQAVLAALEDVLHEIVPKLVAGMRTGEFLVENSLEKDCTSRCDYHTVCRVNQIRPVADRWNKHRPPLVTPKDGT